MIPFPFTGLRLVHDEKVCDAMKRANIAAELARSPRRNVQPSLLSNVLMRIRGRLNYPAQTEHLPRRPRALTEGEMRDSR